MRLYRPMTAVLAAILASTLTTAPTAQAQPSAQARPTAPAQPAEQSAPATGCNWTATTLPHAGYPQSTAVLETAPGEYLGRTGSLSDSQFLTWKNNGTVESTPWPDRYNLGRLNGADGSGRAVGTMDVFRDFDQPEIAFTIKDGSLTLLTFPAGVFGLDAVGVNQNGDIAVVGAGQDHLRYFVWPAGQASPIEVLVHADQIHYMSGITDDRRLAVDWINGDGHGRAATFINGEATLLPLPAGYTESWTGMVAGGWILGGVSPKPNTAAPSVVWDPSGAVHLLPTGFTPHSINRSGAILGDYQGGTVVWHPDGTVQPTPAAAYLASIADDGLLLGAINGVPTTWACR